MSLSRSIYQLLWRGEVFEGAIANALRGYKGETVAIIDSVAASAATLVALGCSTVKMHEDSLARSTKRPQMAMGTAEDPDAQAALLRQINDILAGAYDRKRRRRVESRSRSGWPTRRGSRVAQAKGSVLRMRSSPAATRRAPLRSVASCVH